MEVFFEFVLEDQDKKDNTLVCFPIFVMICSWSEENWNPLALLLWLLEAYHWV